MYIAFHHFKNGNQLPNLPNEICELIRNNVDWDFCHTCGTQINNNPKRITVGYSIIKGYTVCVDCKKMKTLCRECKQFTVLATPTNKVGKSERGVLKFSDKHVV
tara:strand:+ start:918 stop:1229 length:312 start_codon:yes stop_codon:yes gene_type:complete